MVMTSNQTEVMRKAYTVGVPKGEAKWPVRPGLISDFYVARSDQEYFYSPWMGYQYIPG